MNPWKREPFDEFIRENHFRVTEPGTLAAPVNAFTVARNDKLEIIINTVGGKEADTAMMLERAGYHPPGTVRINTDSAVLENFNGTRVTLVGLGSRTTSSSHNPGTGQREVREEVKVHSASAELMPDADVAYTIDWVENVTEYFHWPDGIITTRSTSVVRKYGRADDALTQTHDDEATRSSRAALHLTIEGIEFYLCSSRFEKEPDQIRPGYILYIGAPTNEQRTKIREVLSFVLGCYLVYLGHSRYTADWSLHSFHAISGYSLDKKAFELPVMPPTILSTTAHNYLDHACVLRFASRLFRAYDDLGFGSLSWTYWHARAAPLHVAAVHIGAAIEALQRRYTKLHKADFPSKVITDKKQWAAFNATVNSEIDKLELAPAAREIMKGNLGLLNSMPRKATTDEVLKRTGVTLGKDEADAWKSRHDAAHGNDFDSSHYAGMIRSVKLLKGVFHRMLISIVDGADQYYDYASLDFPLRPVAEPVPPEVTIPSR